MPSDAATPILDTAQAAFIMGPVIITASARSRDNVASVCMALGRKLSADRRTLTILVSPQRAGSLVDDVRRNGTVAIAHFGWIRESSFPTSATISKRG